MGKDLSHYQRYGWRVNEQNLQTLPETAPKAAQDLAQWLTLEGRRSTLEEWIGCCSEDDSRIHGKFWHIGAWTHRMAHTNPNQANPPSVFHDEPKTAVEQVKAKYEAKQTEIAGKTNADLAAKLDKVLTSLTAAKPKRRVVFTRSKDGNIVAEEG